MASPGLTSCAGSPGKQRLSWHSATARSTAMRLPLLSSRQQLHPGTPRRRLHISLSATAAPTAAACSSPPRSTRAGSLGTPAFLSGRPAGLASTRFGSCICRNAPAGGSTGPASNGTGSGEGPTHDDDVADAPVQPGFGRAMSPVSTAAIDISNSSSRGSSSSSIVPGLDPSGLDGTTDDVQLLTNPAAAAAVALPGVSATGPALPAATAAAAAAEAAVAGALDLQTGHAFGAAAGEAVPQVGPSAAGGLQDLFTLLKFQVTSGLPPAQLSSTLVPIVRCAATNQVSMSFLTTGERHTLLLQLMGARDASVAVLAAEAWCRVCGDADLEPWADALLPAVPVLLSIIGANADPESRKVPLLFFAMSSLVRMATLPSVAAAVQQQGGLPKLVAALHVVPAAICQVTTFALFRLMRELDGDMTDEQLTGWQPPRQQQQQQWLGTCSDDGDASSAAHSQQQELALMTFVRAGAFSKLCQVLAQVEQGSAHELAFSMLLSLALIPAAQQAVADQGEVQQLVQVMTAPPSRAVRLEAMLVLGRLAARNRACQQDAVREGVVPVLVEMMMDGSDEERCHSCRLLAILGQHETTHQMIMDWGAVPVMLQLLRNHGSIAPHASTQHIAAQHHNPEPWHEAAPLSEAARAEAEPANADDAADGAESSGSEEEEEEDGVVINAESSSYMTSGPFRAPKRASPHTPTAAAAAAGGGGGSAGGAVVPALKVVVGPELVLEQATGLACMLCHNADNHFHLVNQGLVPLLVGLLQPGTAPKTATYTLASLLMLCMGDNRNAAVVARAGAIPALVSIAREGSSRAANRELASALLAVMCRSQAAQVDVVASGGIPALTRLLAEGTAAACCSAAEALTQIATTSDVRCRLIVRAGALPHLKPMLQPGSSSVSLLWACRLLKALAQERNTLWEVCETPGLLALLPAILNRRPGQEDDLERLIVQFRAAVSAAGAADKARSSSTAADSTTHASVQDAAGSGQDAAGLTRQTDAQQEMVGADGSDLPAGAGEEALDKAQAHVAWLLAALASDPRTRDIMAELAAYLVRPLVVMLRDSQDASGPGYTLQDVLNGMANNRQAAASAALRALSKHVRIAGLIQSEIALQHWMGHNVQLPKAVGEWPPPTPGWFLNVDWWNGSEGGPSEEDRGSWM